MIVFATEKEAKAYYEGVRKGLEMAAWSPSSGWGRYVGSADYMGRGVKSLDAALREVDQNERIVLREFDANRRSKVPERFLKLRVV